MLKLTNLSNAEYDLARFEGAEDMRAFCAAYELDGFELLPWAGEQLFVVPAGIVRGVHLLYYPCFVDYWNGNEEGVLAEFGSLDAAEAYYGGKRRMIDRLRAQLRFAEESGAEYVVFHVSDVSMAETVTAKRFHTDEVVLRAALDWIGAAVEKCDYPFDFLVENLWWPGFDFLRPEMTNMLLDGLPVRRKGVMLDVGHLMHADWDIETEAQGADFVLQQVEKHGALAAQIRGIHLHQCMSGAYARSLAENPPVLCSDYAARLGQVYEHVLRMDGHRPFETDAAARIVRRIAPEYLVHEFITESRAQLETYLRCQQNALRLDKTCCGK